MDNDWTPDEPDFDKHLMNVLRDLHAGLLDCAQEAFEEIQRHPGYVGQMVAPAVMTMRGQPPHG